jgi:hypothetical protein
MTTSHPQTPTPAQKTLNEEEEISEGTYYGEKIAGLENQINTLIKADNIKEETIGQLNQVIEKQKLTIQIKQNLVENYAEQIRVKEYTIKQLNLNLEVTRKRNCEIDEQYNQMYDSCSYQQKKIKELEKVNQDQVALAKQYLSEKAQMIKSLTIDLNTQKNETAL